MKFSRTRLLALLLVAVFSFAAVGATTIASASDATTAAKKKSKKCKKGYKKVGKKCKKKKATKKVSATVSAVSITVTDKSIYKLTFIGTVTTKTPLTTLSVNATAAKGSFDVNKVVTATGDGTTNTLTFTGEIANPAASQMVRPADRKKPVTLVAVADGVSSPTITP